MDITFDILWISEKLPCRINLNKICNYVAYNAYAGSINYPIIKFFKLSDINFQYSSILLFLLYLRFD